MIYTQISNPYLWLAIGNAFLLLIIAVFMLLGAIGFYRDFKQGKNGFTVALMTERLLLFNMFIAQSVSSLGAFYYAQFFDDNRGPLLVWNVAAKTLVVINIILFYVEAHRAKYH